MLERSLATSGIADLIPYGAAAPAPARLRPSPARRPLRHLLAFTGYFVLVLAVQQWAGAPVTGFGAYPDEPSHYVSGLMLYDYVRAGFPAPPLRYATEYYLHLPAVSIGHWGPFFYMIEAAWMLLFGISRPSVLVLVAGVAAAVAFLIYRQVSIDFGGAAGVVAGMLFLLAPAVRWSSGVIMTDMLLALLVFWACIQYGRYLDTMRWQDALWFGVIVSIALLTKPGAFFLALIPPLAVLSTGRFRLIKTFSAWLPLFVVIAVYGPWFALTAHLQTLGLLPASSGFATTLATYTRLIFRTAGAVIVGLALLDWGICLRRLRQLPGRWTVFVIQPPAAILFLSLTPVGPEPRYLIPILPVLLLLACGGICWSLKRFWLDGGAMKTCAGLAACGVASAAMVSPMPRVSRDNTAIARAVTGIQARPELRDAALLVSSSSTTEGHLVAEIALRELRRPSRLVLRATKVLAKTDWNSLDYHLLYTTPEQVMRVLQAVPVRMLLVDGPANPPPQVLDHHHLILNTTQKYPDRWELAAAYHGAASGPVFKVYRLRDGAPLRPARPPAVVVNGLKQKLGGLYR